MDKEDLAKMADELGLKDKNGITKSAFIAGCQLIFKAGGFKSYILLVTIVNATSKALLGYGLPFATNAGLTKAFSYAVGALGWSLTGAWATFDITKPAYRITIPIVITVAALRKQYYYKYYEYYEQHKFDMIRLLVLGSL